MKKIDAVRTWVPPALTALRTFETGAWNVSFTEAAESSIRRDDLQCGSLHEGWHSCFDRPSSEAICRWPKGLTLLVQGTCKEVGEIDEIFVLHRIDDFRH